ncbi:organic hydroperoxide resistance protein [Terriglobus sp.]|uniref:organic hydroperoxide resistance protein n=1 Tax=Terriglobus sp. TaxID=1889013 RepID=UPI003AFFCD17
MALDKVIYTAHATATGGRDGVAKSDDGKLDVKLDPPTGMGGGGKGTNPEQMFAAGYAACFIGALKLVAGTQKIPVHDVSIDSSVNLGPLANGAKGFGIGVDLVVHLPGLERDQAEKLVHEAHEVCPYSNATRGNIDVNLSVA